MKTPLLAPTGTRDRLPSGVQVTLSSLLGSRFGRGGQLGPQLSFRANGRDVSPAEALRSAGWARNGERRDLALCLHGLFIDERNWLWRGAPLIGGLQDGLGWVPLLLRWNTGLPVIQSARALADVIAELVVEAGPSLGRIHLVGHSMGGLLARGVLHVLAEDHPTALERVDGVWLLATPLEGAPLALRFRPVQGAGALHALRTQLSDGIRDAGLGFFHPNQHTALALGLPPEEARFQVPTLDAPLRLYSVAGSLWPRPKERPSRERHDGLVDTLSASGGDLANPSPLTIAPDRFQELPLLAHQAVPVSPRVLSLVSAWQERDAHRPVFFSRATATAKP